MGWRADNLDREYVDIEATETLSLARSSCAVVGQSLEFFVLSATCLGLFNRFCKPVVHPGPSSAPAASASVVVRPSSPAPHRTFSSYSDAKSSTPIRISGRSLNGLGNSRTAFVRSMPSWKTVPLCAGPGSRPR